ncbi:MAG: hypothetical protein ABI321_10755 [Polyangia bacterium]
MWTERAWLGLPVLLAILTFGTESHADRRRVRLGVQPLYTLAFVDRRDPSGGGVGADVAYSLTDALSLRASGFVGWHDAPGLQSFSTGGTISSFGAFAGLTYALDVVRIVPSFDLGLGVLGLRGDARFSSAPALLPSVNALALELGFGFDWLVTHRWSVGAVVRYHALLTELQRAPGFLYAGPRVSLTLP